jgi:hypothetical protein
MKMTLGQRIYYKGDMANIDDAGTIVGVRPADKFAPESYDIDLDDGRTMQGVYHLAFDSGPGRRFVPLDEWRAQREAAIKTSAAAMRAILENPKGPKKT